MRLPKGLYRRGDSKFYWMCYQDSMGKVQRESTKKAVIKEALAELRNRISDVAEGKEPTTKKTNYKFAELATKYTEHFEHQKGFKSKRTFIKQLLQQMHQKL